MTESTNEIVDAVTDDTEPVHEITDLPTPIPPFSPPPPAFFRLRNLETLTRFGFDLSATYYLSGPMSGYPDYNYPEFERVANLLRSAGLNIESPHENPWPENHEDMEQKDLWKHMMDLAYKQLENCKGIILLPGWPQSKGARKELLYGLRRDWPVWYFDGETVYNMNASIRMETDLDATPPTDQ